MEQILLARNKLAPTKVNSSSPAFSQFGNFQNFLNLKVFIALAFDPGKRTCKPFFYKCVYSEATDLQGYRKLCNGINFSLLIFESRKISFFTGNLIGTIKNLMMVIIRNRT